MATLVLFSVAVFVSSSFVKVSQAGTVAFKHQDTTLDELRSIDSYVSSALPVLQDGFFIGTSRGPVLVKSEPLPGAKKRPIVNSKYYNTLPRLIPAGFEGIATSYFNLGAATPIQAPVRPFPFSKAFASPVVAQNQPYKAVPVQQVEQYVSQPVAQSQQYYVTQPQQQFIQDAQPPQQYVSEPQSPSQYVQEEQNPQQYIDDAPQQIQQQNQQQYEIQQQQQQQYDNQAQYPQQNQQYEAQSLQQDQQQFRQPEARNANQQFQYNHRPQQYHVERSPQQFDQQHNIPEQDISEPRQARQPQSPVQFEARNQFVSPNAEPSFQVDNLLRLEKENPSTYQQAELLGQDRFLSQKFIPNAAVLAASDFEGTLPDGFKNQFYKSANLATILAQESLPVQGEQIVREWDTNKIAKGKIHALLRGAGLI